MVSLVQREKVREWNRRYYLGHAEEIKKQKRAYRLEHLKGIRERIQRWRLEHAEELKEYQRKYRLEHEEETKMQQQKYRLGHGEKRRRQRREWYLEHREEMRGQSREYRLKHSEEIKGRMRRHNAEARREALAHYSVGAIPTCAECGETDIDCLVLDHIDGRGRSRWYSAANLRVRGYPEGYQTLCANCNELKEAKGRDYADRTNSACERRRKTKVEVLAYYGGGALACVRCGEGCLECLTIDHINGNGRKHREEIGSHGGLHFYRWLKREGYPKGYQTLCFNDQLKKEMMVIRNREGGDVCQV